MTWLETERVLEKIHKAALAEISERGLRESELNLSAIGGEQREEFQLQLKKQSALLYETKAWNTGLDDLLCIFLAYRVEQALEFARFVPAPSREIYWNHSAHRHSHPTRLFWLLTEYWDRAGCYRVMFDSFSP